MTHNTFKILSFLSAALAVFVGIITFASGIILITKGEPFNGVVTMIGSLAEFAIAVYLYKNFEAKDLAEREKNKPNYTR